MIPWCGHVGLSRERTPIYSCVQWYGENEPLYIYRGRPEEAVECHFGDPRLIS